MAVTLSTRDLLLKMAAFTKPLERGRKKSSSRRQIADRLSSEPINHSLIREGGETLRPHISTADSRRSGLLSLPPELPHLLAASCSTRRYVSDLRETLILQPAFKRLIFTPQRGQTFSLTAPMCEGWVWPKLAALDNLMLPC